MRRLRQQEALYDPERDGRMEVEGDIAVLSALEQQARAVREGKEDPSARIVLFIAPGAMRGVYGAGEATALHEAGLTDGLRAVVGVSTGAPTAAYLLAGDPRKGASIYFEECTSDYFMHLIKRLPDGYAMDMAFLGEIFRGDIGDKALNVERVKAAKPDFRVGITDFETGHGELLDGKQDNLVDMLVTSCAMPVLYRTPHAEVNGIHGTDGALALPFPMHEIMERYQPTHVLVFANGDRGLRQSRLRNAIERAFALSLPKPLRDALLSRDKRFDEGLQFLRKSGVPHLIFWSDRAVHSFTHDPKKLKAAFERGHDHFREQYEAAAQAAHES